MAPYRTFAWLMAAVVVLGVAPTPAASFAALLIAVVLAWTLVRPAPVRTLGRGTPTRRGPARRRAAA